MPSRTYCAHDSMSRAGPPVSSPAQRPTIVSTPSAPMTTFARTVSSPPGARSPPAPRPSAARSMPPASVAVRTAAPAAAACSASTASKRVRSKIQAMSGHATFTSVSSGARMMTRVMRREAQGAPSGSMNSRKPGSPTPSAQRTGAPTTGSRSIRRTSSSGAARLASAAATLPAGPAPTTRMSRPGIRDHREGADGARGHALAAAGARLAIDQQVLESEVDRLGGAEGEAQPAAVAHGEVDDGDLGGQRACERGGRHGANASRRPETRQASALFEVTLFVSLVRSRPPNPSPSDYVPIHWPKLNFRGWSPANEIAVDLGTANTLIWVKGEGIVLNEPSVVAIEKSTGKIKGIGLEAKRMLGRTPDGILAVRPLKDGVIADFDVTEKMLRFFLKTIIDRHLFRVKPKVIVCVPSGITEVEKRAVRDSAQSAGAKEVWMVAEPMAAAIGVGLPVETPTGNMVIDIGGGTTEIAVIALSGIVSDTSIRTGGDELDQAIVQFMRKNYNLLIGEPTAEQIKIQIGSAAPVGEEREMEVKGRDLVSGIPKIVRVHSSEIREAVQEPIQQIVDAVRRALEITPPELASDIVDRGIVMTGGGALIRGLDVLLQQETGLPIHLDEDPMTCVVRGTGRILDDPEKYRNVLTT